MSENVAAPQSTTSRSHLLWLGVALVVQFTTSLVSGVLFLGPMVDTADLPAVVALTAANPGKAYAGIAVDVVTALVVACLGVLWASALEGQGKVASRIGATLFVVESGLLLLSKTVAHGFVLGVEGGLPASGLGALLDATTFAYGLHMLAFCAGALVVYSLLVRSSLLPRWMAWWGMVAMVPVAVGTICGLIGAELPFWIMLPYAPFELVAGAWLVWTSARGNAFGAGVSPAP